MNTIDVEKLLENVGPDDPCGEDMSYHPLFLALKELVKPSAAGIMMTEGEDKYKEPNWREVCDKSQQLLELSKDLGIAVWLTYSLLCLEGISGLENGLLLIRRLLERYWNDAYPRLDPDNPNPVKRINRMEWLSPRSVDSSNPIQFKQRVIEIPLTNSARVGQFCLRDIQIAKKNTTSTSENEPEGPEMSTIEIAFNDTASGYLTHVLRAAEQSIEHLKAIVQIFSEQTVGGQKPDLSGLQETLYKICNILRKYSGKEQDDDPMSEKSPSSACEQSEENDIPNQEIQSAVAIDDSRPSAEIWSRKDVLCMLERIIKYFEQHEPSNPVPLLLQRAKRLVSKSFVEIIEDLCPDAMDRIQQISGAGSTEPE